MPAGGGREPDFLTRHFGTVITALVTVAGLAIGLFQFVVQQDRAEREWNLALSRFVIEHYPALFDETDPLRRARMRALMQSTFPPEVVQSFEDSRRIQLGTVIEQAPTRETVLRAAEDLAELPGPPQPAPTVMATVYLQIVAEEDREFAEALRTRLAGTGFRAPGIELVQVTMRAADVRYYHEEDEARARQVLDLLQSALGDQADVRPTPQFLGARYPNVPRGIIEAWIPPLTG